MIEKQLRKGRVAWVAALAICVGLAMAGGCGKSSKPSKSKKRTAARPSPGKQVGASPKATVSKTSTGIGGKGTKDSVDAITAMTPKGLMKAGAKHPIPAVSTSPIKVELNVVLGVNVAKIRKTFLWKEVMADPTFKIILGGTAYQKICRTINLDPTRVTDRLVLAMASRKWRFSSPDHVVAVFEGRFDTGKVMRALKKLPAGTLGYTKAQKLAGKEALLVVAPGLLPFVLIAVKKNVLAFASPEIAANVALSKPGFGDAALSARANAVSRKALFWGAFGRLDLPFGKSGSMATALTALSQITGGSFELDPKGGKWNAFLRVDATDAQTATGLVTLLSIAKAAFSTGTAGKGSQPALLVNLVQKVQLKTARKSIIARVSLSKTDAKAISQAILGQLR